MRDNDTGEFYPEPPTFRCRRCGEVDFEDKFDESGHCAECARYWESLMLSDVVCGVKL